MSGDSQELEDLFDSLSTIALPTPVKPAVAQAAPSDTPELEALFDSITAAVTHDGASAEGEACSEQVFSQIGHMTRELNNLLRELGYDKSLESVASEMPDTRDRLNYVAAMTAQAAERTLNAAEIAQPIQAKLGESARDLSEKWQRLNNKQLGVDDFKALVKDTQTYLAEVPNQTEATNAQLMEIVMAQDFQDLTGQVIKKTLEAAQRLESQLLALLIQTTPEEMRQSVGAGLLNGPVVNTAGRNDIVTSQEQVDDLLESLGF